MANIDYEKIGKIIFGVQRLNVVLSGLTSWMAETPLQVGSELDAGTLTAHSKIAEEFFLKHKSDPSTKEKFRALLEKMTMLQLNQDQMAKRAEAGELEEYVSATREAHVLLAELVDSTGYPGIRSKDIANSHKL